SRRGERVRFFCALELDAEEIQCAGRDEALEEGLLAAPQSHDRAFEGHLACANSEKRFGLGTRQLCALLGLSSLPGRYQHEVVVARLKADELVPVRVSGEVTLTDLSSHALLLADQASQ